MRINTINDVIIQKYLEIEAMEFLFYKFYHGSKHIHAHIYCLKKVRPEIHLHFIFFGNGSIKNHHIKPCVRNKLFLYNELLHQRPPLRFNFWKKPS